MHDVLGPATMFEDGSAFLGLVALRPESRLCRVWSDCAFADPVAYTVYPADGRFRVRRVTLVRAPHLADPQPWGADGVAETGPIRALLEELRALRLAPFARSDETGRDGCHHGVETFGFERSARLVWWETPSGWEELSAWHARATALLGSCVAAHRPGRGP